MDEFKSPKIFVFVNLALSTGTYSVNHGIAYLVPIIKKNLFKVVIINLFSDISSDEFRKQIEVLNPSVVGFSFTSLHTKHLIKYSKAIEGLSGCLQIAGGVGATLDPEGILPQTRVDGFVIGEGEIPLDSLLKAINEERNIYETEGFCWRKDGIVKRSGTPRFVNDLCQLDFPDYSGFDRSVIVFGVPLNINIMLSRGCPYSCTYCSNKALRSVYPKHDGYFRIPSVEYSINLVERTVKQFPEAKFVSFEDDLLIARKDWFISFAYEFRKRIGLPYKVNVRTECIDDEIVKTLKESGCAVGFLGLESGSEKLRRKLLNRHHSNEMLIEKALMVKKAGIKLFTFNIVGFPFETKENMRETLELNKKIKADCGMCTFFYPFPGTELHEVCKKEGLLKDEDTKNITNYFVKPLIPKTIQQKMDCIKARKRIDNYLKWQELKYNAFRSPYTGKKLVVYIVRLVTIYLLNRFTSPFNENSLYRRIQVSKSQKWLKDMLR